MNDDPRIAIIADTLKQLAAGEIHVHAEPTDRGDNLDALIAQINHLSTTMTQQQQRLEEMLEVLGGMAALDFTHKAYVGDEGSILDAMAFGINMLSEELAASTISRTDMDQIFESMLDALVVSNMSGQMTMVNRATTRLLGASRDDLLGKPLRDIFVDPQDADLIAARVAQEGGARRMEINCRTANGSVVTAVSASTLDNTHGRIGGVVYIIRDISERKRAEEVMRQNIAQEETIRAQAAILTELSTPLIPISKDVVVMPLIGAIDSYRAQQVLETLLEGISSVGAEVAILDITGVPVVDTHVANGLIQAAQAVRLLGARVMLTGIRPEVAQTLVGLGVNLQGIITHSTLQSGIASVLRWR